MKKLNSICFGLFLSCFLLFCDSTRADKQSLESKKDEKKEGKKEGKKTKEATSPEVKIVKKHELPGILREVSGIAYLSENRFACVQDEAGAIFIYNTSTTKIEKQVSFGAAGDYEGLAIVGKTAYIARSDGQLFEIVNIENSSPKINEHTTGLTAKNDIEGLTYDPKNNRLLLAIKGEEADKADYKGIYSFDLGSKKLSKMPAYKIDLTDAVFSSRSGKKLTRVMNPSEIAVHPVTGHIYITEGTNPQLLILESTGKIKGRYVLDKSEFSQPEGMTFSPTGKLFISNEGTKESGNILEVQIANL